MRCNACRGWRGGARGGAARAAGERASGDLQTCGVAGSRSKHRPRWARATGGSLPHTPPDRWRVVNPDPARARPPRGPRPPAGLRRWAPYVAHRRGPHRTLGPLPEASEHVRPAQTCAPTTGRRRATRPEVTSPPSRRSQDKRACRRPADRRTLARYETDRHLCPRRRYDLRNRRQRRSRPKSRGRLIRRRTRGLFRSMAFREAQAVGATRNTQTAGRGAHAPRRPFAVFGG